MNLRELQQHFQIYVTSMDQSDPQKIAAEKTLEGLINSPVEQGLGIYRSMFRMRVIECLVDDYPLLCEIVGLDTFKELSLRYIVKYPSRTFTLEKLGDFFPDFVAEENLIMQSFPYASDVAALEFAVVHARHARETDVIDARRIDLTDLEYWMHIRLIPVPSASLLELQYDVNQLYSRFRRDSQKCNEAPEKNKLYLLVYKHKDKTWRMPLGALAFRFLQQLKSGMTMAEAVDELLLAQPSPEQIDNIFRSFKAWVAEGIFEAPNQQISS